MIKNKQVLLLRKGMIRYAEAWKFQEEVFSSIIDQKMKQREDASLQTPNYLIVCEHPHVYTLGKSGHQEYLLLNDDRLKEINAEYFRINRGGDITYHGPGQLVVYPLIDLDNFFTDIHKYLRLLEETVIRTLNDFGIKAGRYPGYTGVWIDADNESKARKICAMGVRCSRWVTMHGLALNVNTDLNYFNHIIPCGIKDKAVTSIEQELHQKIPMEDVVANFLIHFGEIFECRIKTDSVLTNHP